MTQQYGASPRMAFSTFHENANSPQPKDTISVTSCCIYRCNRLYKHKQFHITNIKYYRKTIRTKQKSGVQEMVY